MPKLVLVCLSFMLAVRAIGNPKKFEFSCKKYLYNFLCRNRFKSSDLCLGFCDAALDQFSSSNPSSNTGLSSTSTEEKSPLSFVTEPPLGPRPDLIEDDDQDDDQTEIDEEYDESRCQVCTIFTNTKFHEFFVLLNF